MPPKPIKYIMIYEELKTILAMHMEQCPCYKNGNCLVGLETSKGCKYSVPKNVVIAHMVEDPSDPKQKQHAEKILMRLREMGYIELCPGFKYNGTYAIEGAIIGIMLGLFLGLFSGWLFWLTFLITLIIGAMTKSYSVCSKSRYVESKNSDDAVERVLFLK